MTYLNVIANLLHVRLPSLALNAVLIQFNVSIIQGHLLFD